MAYIGNSPENIQRGRRNVYEFKATAGQTAFSGTDLNNQTLDLLEENEMGVYLNGVRLADSDDYTVSGDTLTLISAASLNDQLTVETQAEIANISSYTRAEADARYINYDGDIVAGDLQISGEVDAGSLIVDTDVLVVDATNDIVGIGTATPSTTASGYEGGTLHIHNAGTGASIRLTNSTTGTGTSAGMLISKWSDSKTYFTNFDNGADMVFTPTNSSGSLVSNTFVIKSDGKIGIGTASPSQLLTVAGVSRFENYIEFSGSISTPSTAAAIYRPADNQLAFSTANNEAVRIDAAGNVGIGHTSPDEKLDVKGNFTLRDTTGNLSHGMSVFGDNDQYAIFNQEVSGDGGLRITTLSDASSAASAFQLNAVATTPSTDGNNAAIRLRAAKKSGSTETSLASTEDVLSIGNTGTELVVVKGSGNVGIGTSSPEDDVTKFGGSVKGLSVAAGQVAIAVRATGNAQHVGYFGQSGSNTYLGGVGGGDLYFQTSTSGLTRMTIKSDGDVGIGTTSPSSNGGGTAKVLHVHSPNANAWAVTKYTNSTSGTGNGDGSVVGHIGSDAYLFNYESGNIYLGTSGGTKMTIDSAGRVGIGITPAAVSDTTGSDSLQLGGSFLIHFDEDGSGTTSLANNLYWNGSNNKALFSGYTSQYYQTNGIHYWRNSQTTSAGATVTMSERMKLDNSGRLIIGTATDSNAHANADDLIIGNVPASGERRGITIVTGNDTSGAIHFSDGTASGNANIQGQLTYEHSDNSFRFYTAAAQRARLDADGLKFGSDSAAANALDDYEEGTWTPYLARWTGGAISATYTQQLGRYTKVGRLVTLSFSITTSAISSQGSSLLYIGGAPYNNNANHNYMYAGTFGIRDAISNSTVATSFIKHSSNTSLLIRQDNNFDENVDDNWIVGTMRGSITYEHG